MQKKIYVGTEIRGFLSHLFKSESLVYRFEWNENHSYEINSRKKKILNRIAKSFIFDFFGIIKIKKINIKDNDLIVSYNKFLKTDGPYIIILENPYALTHYSLRKNNTFFGKRKIRKYLDDKNLKAIICISKSCENLFKKTYSFSKNKILTTIYPLIPNGTREIEYPIDFINALYISSDFNLKGGREILELFTNEKYRNSNINLTIITPINKLTIEQLEKIKKSDIELLDFSLSYEELTNIYKRTNIYLNPTRQDSLALVVLEAMKYGNAVISSDLFAIPEMVKEGINGFYLKPKYRFFNEDGTANAYVWNNRTSTIYADFIDDAMVKDLSRYLNLLDKDRSKLFKMMEKSYNIANEENFSYSTILEQWERLIKNV